MRIMIGLLIVMTVVALLISVLLLDFTDRSKAHDTAANTPATAIVLAN